MVLKECLRSQMHPILYQTHSNEKVNGISILNYSTKLILMKYSTDTALRLLMRFVSIEAFQGKI